MNNNASPVNRLATVVLLCFGLSGCVTTTTGVFTQKASPQEAMEKRVELARNYIGEGNWRDAKRNLKLAYEIEPNAPEVHEAFALVYQSTGEYELADISFSKALSLDPSFSRGRNNYAAFLYQQGRFAEAEKQLETVVKDMLYESRPQAFINLGLCRMRLQKLPEARVALERALTMDRTNTIALEELAHIEYEEGNYEKALRYYDYLRSLVGQLSPRTLWLGIRLADKLDDKNAKASYILALRNMYPKSAEYRVYQKAVNDGTL